MMVSGIYFILRTGVPWIDLPREFGPWPSVYTRFRRWCRIEIWSKILAQLADDTSDKVRSVDCTHIKVHQDGANAVGGAGAQAIGSTKGESDPKLAVVIDGIGRAVGLNLVPGNRHDLRAVNPLIDKLAGCLAIANRGFDAKKFRAERILFEATPCIPSRVKNRIQFHYSKLTYSHRHVIENCFARIKRFRRVATRYDKLSETSLGFVTLASILDWLHFEV